MGRSGRSSDKRNSNHPEQLAGVHASMEAIRAQRRKLRVLRVREGRQRPEVAAVVAAARQAGIPVELIGDAQFAEFAPAGGNPQRVLLEAEPLPELSLESLLQSIETEDPTLVALDGVEDPQNLGAIARVAEAAGVAGLILPRRRSAPLSPAVAPLVSIGTAQNGVPMRGKKTHIERVSGSAYNMSLAPVLKLSATLTGLLSDMRSHAVMVKSTPAIRYGSDQMYCSRSSDDMIRKIEIKSSTNWSRRRFVSSNLSAAITASSADPGPTPLTDSYDARTPMQAINDRIMRSHAGGSRCRLYSTCSRHAQQNTNMKVTQIGKY